MCRSEKTLRERGGEGGEREGREGGEREGREGGERGEGGRERENHWGTLMIAVCITLDVSSH